MSSIWHDPDFEPVRQFQAPLVTKNFDDLPVPTELHELPDGVADPFAKQDAAWDVAAQQMERGLKGAEFLHGKAPVRIDSAIAGADDVTRLQHRPDRFEPAVQKQQVLTKEVNEHHRRLDQAAVVATAQPSSSSSSSSTAAGREAKAIANAGGVDGAALTFAPMVAGQLAAAAVPGPLPALATQATSATQLVTAVSAAGEIAVAGAAGDVGDLDGGPAAPRRGLSR